MPASQVIQKCGGISATAGMLSLHRSVVNRWLLPRSSGGTGGLVPAKHQQALLEAARARGIALLPSDFFEPAAGAATPKSEPQEAA